MADDLVRLSRPEEQVVQLTLCRPEVLNALDSALVSAVYEALDAVESDRDCRVVILTGAGRGFCAGLDLNGNGFDEEGRQDTDVGLMLARQRELAGLSQRLHHLRQPVIAAVNGPAAGGGLALACASDIRIAAPSAVFAVSFIRAGYSACDLGVSWLLPRLIGAARAHDWMLTGRRVDAEEALAAGLICDIVDEDGLLERALGKAREILLNPPLSVELTKQGMWQALETAGFDATIEFENRQQMLTAMTADQSEATRAFLEKRPPTYRRR